MNHTIDNSSDIAIDEAHAAQGFYFPKNKNNICTYTPVYSDVFDQRIESQYTHTKNEAYRQLDNSDTIAVCLTAYNESFDLYKTSLNALSEAAQYFNEKKEESLSNNFLICIIVDGMDTMDPSFVNYAEKLGIYSPDLIDDKADYHIFESTIPRWLISESDDSDLMRNALLAEHDKDLKKYMKANRQRITLIVKNKNRGKLHSHKCFFEIACKLYTPDFFLQIDVGTSPNKEAVYLMWKHLFEHPNIAATAARSLLPSPKHKIDLLSIWQFCDIALERVINWPTEIFMGNLSVLPGQLSLTRMASVTEKNSTSSDSPQVLDNYYKGLVNLTPLESNMYLAEDRILGLEMVFQNKNKWELGYEINAEATVDACESWGELLRQRRRWICSSIACRISMLARLPIIFSNDDRTPPQQIHKVIAGLYSIIFSLFCWFVPTFHLLIQTTLHGVAAELVPLGYTSTLFESLWIACCLSFIPQIYSCMKSKLTKTVEPVISLSIYIQVANIFVCCSLLLINQLNLSVNQFNISSHQMNIPGSKELFVVFSLMLLGYSLLSLAYGKKLFQQLAKNIIQYSLCRPVVASFLMLYSVMNCHDTSWGTKGLESTTTQDKQTNTHYKHFRLKVASLFFGTNILLFLLLNVFGVVNSLYSVAAIVCIALLQISIAFIALLAKR